MVQDKNLYQFCIKQNQGNSSRIKLARIEQAYLVEWEEEVSYKYKSFLKWSKGY